MYELKTSAIRTAIAVLLLISFSQAHLHAQDQVQQGFKYIQAQVVGPNGEPMTDVEIQVSIDGPSFPMGVNDQGTISLNVPSQGSWFQLRVVKEGYVATGARWGEEDEVPEEISIPLQKGICIGGTVHNEAGEPVEGATVKGTITYNSHVHGEAGKGVFRPMLYDDIATTDSKGHWKACCISDQPLEMSLKFSHPDHVETRLYLNEKEFQQLRKLDLNTQLREGITLLGSVVDPKGQPIVGAHVGLGASQFTSNQQETETDDAGKYRIEMVPPGIAVITVTSPSWAPELRVVNLEPGLDLVDFQLHPGKTVRIQVVDEHANPLEGVNITPHEWRGYQTLWRNRSQTNSEGYWQWDHAPEDRIRYSISKQGRFSINEQDEAVLSPAAEPHILTMLPAVLVTGSVVDQSTGKPLDKFNYINSVWWSPLSRRFVLQTSNVKRGSNGQYEFPMSSSCEKFRLRFEAEGYLPVTTRPILPSEGKVTINVQLEPGTGPEGVIQLPDGSPAEAAQVIMATVDESVHLQNGRFRQQNNGNTVVIADAKGRFKISEASSEYILVVLHEQGWAEVTREQLDDSTTITLTPWATLSGMLLVGDQAQPDKSLRIWFNRSFDPLRPYVSWEHQVETDAQGEFTFDRLVDEKHQILWPFNYAQTGNRARMHSYRQLPIKIAAGKNHQVQLGGIGRDVTGKLTLPSEVDASHVNWGMGLVELTALSNDNDESSVSNEIRPPNRAMIETTGRLEYAAPVNGDGSFIAHDILPGHYFLQVYLFSSYPGNYRAEWPILATLTQEIEVTQLRDQAENNPLDLGRLVLKTTEDEN